MVLIREDEFNELRKEVHETELNIKEESVYKPKELTNEQKDFLDATKRNSEQEFIGLTKENLVPIGDKLLVKVAVQTKTEVGLYVPTANRDVSKGNALVKYCEIVKISPKLKKELAETIPELTEGWRCKFNVNLALSIANGACLVEKDENYIYNYYTVGIGLIDYVYPPTV